MTRWVVGSLLFVLAAGLAVGIRSLPSASRADVIVKPAEVTTPAAWIEAVGYVEPRSEIRRLAFLCGGVISRCGPRPGERVSKGQEIARLDDAAAAAAIEIARRRVEVARSDADDELAGANPRRLEVCAFTIKKMREQARYLHAEVNRLRRMHSSASVAESELEVTVTKAVQADIAVRGQEAELDHLRELVTPERRRLVEARVLAAVAELADAERRLTETRLVAPFDGVVLRYLRREGEGVSPLMPPEPVVLFGDLGRLRVRAEVDERHARRPSIGDAAEVYGRNVQGHVFKGIVVEVEHAMGDKSVFTRAASERKDLHVLQVVIEMGEDFAAPVGLQVDVRIRPKQ